jgi:phage FluMu protein gp41
MSQKAIIETARQAVDEVGAANGCMSWEDFHNPTTRELARLLDWRRDVDYAEVYRRARKYVNYVAGELGYTKPADFDTVEIRALAEVVGVGAV